MFFFFYAEKKTSGHATREVDAAVVEMSASTSSPSHVTENGKWLSGSRRSCAPKVAGASLLGIGTVCPVSERDAWSVV